MGKFQNLWVISLQWAFMMVCCNTVLFLGQKSPLLHASPSLRNLANITKQCMWLKGKKRLPVWHTRVIAFPHNICFHTVFTGNAPSWLESFSFSFFLHLSSCPDAPRCAAVIGRSFHNFLKNKNTESDQLTVWSSRKCSFTLLNSCSDTLILN